MHFFTRILHRPASDCPLVTLNFSMRQQSANSKRTNLTGQNIHTYNWVARYFTQIQWRRRRVHSNDCPHASREFNKIMRQCFDVRCETNMWAFNVYSGNKCFNFSVKTRWKSRYILYETRHLLKSLTCIESVTGRPFSWCLVRLARLLTVTEEVVRGLRWSALEDCCFLVDTVANPSFFSLCVNCVPTGSRITFWKI